MYGGGSHDKKQLMISFAHSVIPQNSIRSHILQLTVQEVKSDYPLHVLSLEGDGKKSEKN